MRRGYPSSQPYDVAAFVRHHQRCGDSHQRPCAGHCHSPAPKRRQRRLGWLDCHRISHRVFHSPCRRLTFRVNLRIPSVHAFYTKMDPRGHSISYVVMEHMEGQILQPTLEALDDTTKADVCTELRGIFDAARSIPSRGYFGCVGRQPLEVCMSWTRPDNGGQVEPSPVNDRSF